MFVSLIGLVYCVGAAMEPKRADEENKRALERRDLGLRDQNSPAFPESYVDMWMDSDDESFHESLVSDVLSEDTKRELVDKAVQEGVCRRCDSILLDYERNYRFMHRKLILQHNVGLQDVRTRLLLLAQFLMAWRVVVSQSWLNHEGPEKATNCSSCPTHAEVDKGKQNKIPPELETFMVHIRPALSKWSFWVRASEADLVDFVKEKIEEQEQIPTKRQRLLLHGKELAGNATLGEVGIHRGDFHEIELISEDC